MKLSNFKESATRKILIYGPPKSGKTALAGTLAAHKKLHWFDLEAGINTLLQPGYNIDNIEYFKLPDSQGFPIAVETLIKVLKGGDQKICHDHGKVNCPACKLPDQSTLINVDKLGPDDVLVIDSVSQLTNSIMNFILKDRLLKDVDVKPTFDDWARSGLLMDRIFSIIQQARFNVIAISHETMVEMEDGKKRIVPLAGSSNVSKTFAKYWDDVVYCEVLNKKYRRYSSVETCAVNATVGSRNGVTLSESDGLIKLFG